MSSIELTHHAANPENQKPHAVLNVLVGCELSGQVRRAFRACGHNAWSCDLEPCDDGDAHHYQQDIFTVLEEQPWDLAIFHPPCTYLTVAGMHRTVRGLRPASLTEDALDFVQRLLDCPIPHTALENPVGVISTRIRKPDQYVQPHEFGDDASKKTGLWLKCLPCLAPTSLVPPRMVNGLPRWGNQTDSGQNRLGPSPDRAKLRSATYPGLALAMARQWGGYVGATKRS